MSYIRSTSNPEGLYIWGDVSGDAIIAAGVDNWRRMPDELFETLLESWVKNWYEDVTLTMVIDDVKHEVSLTGSGGAGTKLLLEYKNDEGTSWKLDDIWLVTMHYIASRYENPYYGAGRFKRLALRLLGV